MSERRSLPLDYETHNASGGHGHVLVTDRPIGFDPDTAKADGWIYIFDSPDWSCPSMKMTPSGARDFAQNLLAMAEVVEAWSKTDA